MNAEHKTPADVIESAEIVHSMVVAFLSDYFEGKRLQEKLGFCIFVRVYNLSDETMEKRKHHSIRETEGKLFFSGNTIGRT